MKGCFFSWTAIMQIFKAYKYSFSFSYFFLPFRPSISDIFNRSLDCVGRPRYSAVHSTASGGDRSKFRVGMGENSVCGMGSVLIMLVVVGCILFLPLVIGSVQPPSGLMLLIFPVTLAAVFFFLSRASSNWKINGEFYFLIYVFLW